MELIRGKVYRINHPSVIYTIFDGEYLIGPNKKGYNCGNEQFVFNLQPSEVEALETVGEWKGALSIEENGCACYIQGMMSYLMDFDIFKKIETEREVNA